MSIELRIFIAVLAVLASVTLMVMFRKNAVYVFVALWLVLPKLGYNLFGINLIPTFSFVELACSLVLLVIALQSKKGTSRRGVVPQGSLYAFNVEGAVIGYVALVVLVQHCVLMWIPYMISGLHVDIPGGRIFSSIGREVAAAIFFFACYRLITTTEQVERILKLFIMITVVVSLELLSVLWIKPIGNIIGGYSLDKHGSFNSILINDSLLAGLLAAAGALASLHFYRKEQSRRWIITFLMAPPIIIFSFSRGTMLAFALAVGAFVYLAYFRQWSIWKRILCTTALVVGMLIMVNPSRIGSLTIFLSDSVSNETKYKKALRIADTSSINARFGMQLRAVEVMVHIFPLGVGGDMIRYYMGGDAPRIYYLTEPGLYEGYSRVAENLVSTETHSGYIEQLSSYGVLGLFSIFLFAAVLYRNLTRSKDKGRTPHSYYPLVVSFTVLLGVYYFFYGYPRVYIIFFFVLHMSFLMVREENNKIHARTIS